MYNIILCMCICTCGHQTIVIVYMYLQVWYRGDEHDYGTIGHIREHGHPLCRKSTSIHLYTVCAEYCMLASTSAVAEDTQRLFVIQHREGTKKKHFQYNQRQHFKAHMHSNSALIWCYKGLILVNFLHTIPVCRSSSMRSGSSVCPFLLH